MIRGSNVSRGGDGGGWGDYESNDGGFRGGGGRIGDGGGRNGGGRGGGGGYHRNRNPYRGGGRGGRDSRSSNDRRAGDRDDAAWEECDGVHGRARPNSGNVQRGHSHRQNQNRNERARNHDPSPRRSESNPQSANRSRSRGNGGNGGDYRGRSPNNDFPNNGRKHAPGGNNARGGNNNGENNYNSSNNGYGSNNRNPRQPNFRNDNHGNHGPPSSSDCNDEWSPRPDDNFRDRSPRPSRQQSHGNAPSHNDDAPPYPRRRPRKVQLRVLYTHQKTKKKKSWKDGRLTLSGTSGSLYDARPNPGSSGGALDVVELTRTEADALADGSHRGYDDDPLESERYLIQVEGPWAADGRDGGGDADPRNDPLWNKRPPPPQSLMGRGRGRGPRPSAGMQRVLGTKFRVPGRIRPMDPRERREKAWREGGMGKRRRPLQPGELERQFYGDDRDGDGYGGHERGYGGGGGHGRSGGGYDEGDGGGGQNGGGYNGDGGGYIGQNGRGRDGDWNDGGGEGYGNNGGGNHSGWQGNDCDQNNQGCQRDDGPGPKKGDWENDGRGQRGNERFEGGPLGSRGPRGTGHGRNGRGGRDDGPAQFQSNEYDPNGFYGVEEESEEDEDDRQGGDIGTSAGHGGVLGGQPGERYGYDEARGGEEQAAPRSNEQHLQPQNFQGQRQHGEGRKEALPASNEPRPNDGETDGEERCRDAVQRPEAHFEEDNSMSPHPTPAPQTHRQATSQELLELLGGAPDETSPAPRTSQGPPPTDDESTDTNDRNGDEAGQTNGRGHQSTSNNSNGNEAGQNVNGGADVGGPRNEDEDGAEGSSFLASILQAQERANDRGFASGESEGGLSFSGDALGGWGDERDFEDDDDDDDGDGGNDDVRETTKGDTEVDRGGDEQNDDGQPHKKGEEGEEGGTSFVGFTLPSADESSSEDEED